MTYPLKCRIRATGTATRVDVYDDIGGGLFGGGIAADDFAGQLAEVKGALDVHINSGGGDVFDGLAIAQAIRSHRGPVTTVVDGIAASIASVIAQAGHTRVMAPGSMMMIHDAYGAVTGNEAEVTKFAGTLGQVSENLATVYAARAGGDAASWRAAMRDETWYSADEAVAAGLADRVGGDVAQLPVGLDVAAIAPARIAAQLRALAEVPRAAAEPSCAELGHQCCKSANAALDALRGAVLRAAGGPPMHGDHARYDPDGDGDCDACPEGDTDHDYWSADGEPLQGQPPMENAARPLAAEKYSTDDRKSMASKGHAMPDGSYPIADGEDLENAIHAVGRGGSDHDAIRRHIIKRAAALGQSSKIPENWNSDGSMKDALGQSAEVQFLALVAGERGQLSAGKEQ